MSSIIDSMDEALLPYPDTVNWDEGRLTPEAHTTMEKVRYYASNALQFIANSIILPFAVAYSAARSLAKYCISWYNKPVFVDETPPERPAQRVDLASVLPPLVGFADSLYQSSLLGTPYSATCKPGTAEPLDGTSYWAKNLNSKHIEGNPTFSKFGLDILGDPDRFIEMLKATHSNAYRFPIPWSIVETSPGVFNQDNIGLLRTFVIKLIDAGIEPLVTIHHYDHPQWFEDMGGFHNPENVERFKNHALQMIRLLPEVATWYSFNEIGGLGLETFLGDFPAPDGVKLNHAAEGRLLRNVLMAHCKTYQAAKAEFADRIQIGITHQFLGFRPMTGNFIEKLVCNHLSKLAHETVYEFFKTGVFNFRFAGLANVNFSIPKDEFEKNHKFLDLLGVQAYGDARFIFASNGGVPYPGPKVTNINWGGFGFSVGATCEDGKRISSFGPEIDPTTFKKVLEQAKAITNNLHITEIGCDARSQIRGEVMKLNREAQRKYFEDLAPILAQFQDDIKVFLVWTLFGGAEEDEEGQLEWQRGKETNLPVMEVIRGPDRRIEDYRFTPAAEYLKDSFGQMQERAQQAADAG
jgi:beta-glucosidase/6-phospho-beta-glucosidase/beta-galactosidase